MSVKDVFLNIQIDVIGNSSKIGYILYIAEFPSVSPIPLRFESKWIDY